MVERRFVNGFDGNDQEEDSGGLLVGKVEVSQSGAEENETEGEEGKNEVGAEQLVDPATWVTFQEVATAVLANHSKKCDEVERDYCIRKALAWVYSMCLSRGVEPDRAGEWLELLMRIVNSDLQPGEVKSVNGKGVLGFRVNGNGG